MELLPARVGQHPTGKILEGLELDPVHYGDRLALTGQQHEQAPGVESVQPEQAARYRIESVELEQQPRVGAYRIQRRPQLVLLRNHSYISTGVLCQTQSLSPRPRQRSWIIAPSKSVNERSSSL
jgi:hypothetical protein